MGTRSKSRTTCKNQMGNDRQRLDILFIRSAVQYCFLHMTIQSQIVKPVTQAAYRSNKRNFLSPRPLLNLQLMMTANNCTFSLQQTGTCSKSKEPGALGAGCSLKRLEVDHILPIQTISSRTACYNLVFGLLLGQH